ncbi:hypothetical protein Bca52824_081998 [Brassica carinata]|uniref:Uncharacterized protein n=1 Tax=Brassica carinata TaxID=52824 RepID=A0A8X7PJL1_BRACI|nr:hypothetical protein Bca52824_081998 [Brassica carinata]
MTNLKSSRSRVWEFSSSSRSRDLVGLQGWFTTCSAKLDIKKKYEMWSRWSRTFEHRRDAGLVRGRSHAAASPSSLDSLKGESFQPLHDLLGKASDGFNGLRIIHGGESLKVLMDSLWNKEIAGCYTVDGFIQVLQVWTHTAMPNWVLVLVVPEQIVRLHRYWLTRAAEAADQ